MWTAATTAYFLSIALLFLQRRKCQRADSSSSNLFRFVPDLFCTTASQETVLGFLPGVSTTMQEAGSSTSKRFSGESNYYFIYFAFPCSSKPLWILCSVHWDCQSSLLMEGLHSGCSPQHALLKKRLWEAQAYRPVSLSSLWQLREHLGEQGRVEPTGGPPNEDGGPAVLWYNWAPESHINIIWRHFSSSVYFVHKPSFSSMKFNKHLLNICAASDHVQDTEQ